jgi:hypothetical protein
MTGSDDAGILRLGPDRDEGMHLPLTLRVTMNHAEWVDAFATTLRLLRPHMTEKATVAVGEALIRDDAGMPPAVVAADYHRASDAVAFSPPKSRAPAGPSVSDRRRS